jgi:hypothetical protein
LSKIEFIALLLFAPLGIFAVTIVASYAKNHFQNLQYQKGRILLIGAIIGVIWLLGITLAYIQWWQNRNEIEFSLRWLVIRSHRWQLQSNYRYLYLAFYHIPLLLWQIWLLIELGIFRRRLSPLTRK